MGHMFSKPNSALMQQGPGGLQPSFIGAPSQVLSRANAGLPSPAAMTGPDVLNPENRTPNLPFIGQPSFAQAAQTGAMPGGANAMSPGLSKAGKLATLLMSGLQGALAGRQASEQAVLASGGRRSGGIGTGFEAGYMLPFQRAGAQQQLAQQQAQTELMKSQADTVETPMGPMPGWLLKQVYPALIRGETSRDVQGMKGQTQESIQGQKSETAQSIQGQKSKTAMDVAALNQGMQMPVDETVANLAGYPELAGQKLGKASWANVNKALTAKGYKTQDLGTDGMWLIDRGGNKLKRIGDSPSLARAQARPMEVVDPDNPQQTKIVSGGTAIQQGMPGKRSASLAVAKRAAIAEVPTKIGDQKVAFTTMITHASLLRTAAKALNNGDMQTLNGLQNAFKNEFGYSGPITAKAIADAYKGEVSNVINKGHITDKGNEKIEHTLDPTKQNYQTIDSVLGAYQALAQSKMNMLSKQEHSAIIQAQPKKKAAANDPLGIR